MELYKAVRELSGRVETLKSHVATEEATKTAFVLPMLVALGYDVYNPLEVIPEMDCDISRKGDKVDYAININSKPALIIECKQCMKNLDDFVLQLSKYYVAARARFAVLTNGIEYRFYADIERVNLMDSKPFFVFDLSSFDERDVELLGRFSKDSFDELKILQIAENRDVEGKVADFMQNVVFKCSEAFVDYVAGSIGCDSCKEDVARLVRIQLENATSFNSQKEDAQTQILNGEDYKAYKLVKNILKGYASEDDIKYTSFKSYFAVNKYGSALRWIIRVKHVSGKVKVCFPMNAYMRNEWVTLNTIDELANMRDRVVESFRMASFEKSRQNAVKLEKTANKPQIKSI